MLIYFHSGNQMTADESIMQQDGTFLYKKIYNQHLKIIIERKKSRPILISLINFHLLQEETTRLLPLCSDHVLKVSKFFQLAVS